MPMTLSSLPYNKEMKSEITWTFLLSKSAKLLVRVTYLTAKVIKNFKRETVAIKIFRTNFIERRFC